MNMKKLLFALSLTPLLFSCGNNEQPQKASTELIINPVTADSTSAPAPSGKGAVMVFEKTEHNFGTITQGEQAEYNFKFRNTGDQDLVISSANASCGCTVPEYSKEPIKPGATGSIKVIFNSEHRLDAFEKAVTVTANTQPLETLLKIKGFINPKPESTNPKPNPTIH
jgi:hypothetical protein